MSTSPRAIVLLVCTARSALAAPPLPPNEDPVEDAAPAAPASPSEEPSPIETSLSGYFRAPFAVGISRRPAPDGTGPKQLQLVHAPNRLVDANYDHFAYTRLQEADWAEFYVTAKKDHVEATIGLMGYWYAWAGYEKPEASWLPAQAWLTLDADFAFAGLRPHIELKGGAFWQRWGMFEKYDTYLFGRFHQIGVAAELELPLSERLSLRLTEGVGGHRDGSSTEGTGLSLLHYSHVGVRYGEVFDLGAYYAHNWTRDPTLFSGPEPAGGGTYAEARRAQLSVAGLELEVEPPRVGRAWLALSYLDIENGWALPPMVEVIHSPGGRGLAENYLGYGEPGSTGSGSVWSAAGIYENDLNTLVGASKARAPNLELDVFGMLAYADRERSLEATFPEHLEQLKWGADLTLYTEPWLGFMLRFDSVELDSSRDQTGFMVLTPRVIFASELFAKETLYIQYSRYFYGDEVILPVSETNPYPRPDRHVVKAQATVSF